MKYQPTDALLAAGRQNTESNIERCTTESREERAKIALDITDKLRKILHDTYLSTLGRLSDTERQYIYDAARGRYQTVDLARVILAVRRSRLIGLRNKLHDYLRGIAATDERPILALERALLRRCIEQSEANTSVERYRFRPSVEAIDAAIREVEDDIIADNDLKASLLAERARLTA